MDFGLAGSLMTMQHTHVFPKFSTAGAAVGLGVFLQIFDIRKVILVQVEVKSTWVVAKGAVSQLRSDLRSEILFLFFYVFFSLLSIGFSGFEGIDKNVDFI